VEWLARVMRNWTVLGRDLKIYERDEELEAYRKARVQVFLLPGEATSVQLVHLVEVNLARMCAIATTSPPGSWRLTEIGPEPYDIPGRRRRRRT
jgi:hypothetical protein